MDGNIEGGWCGFIEFNFDDLFHTACSDHNRNTGIKTVHTVFTIQQCGTGQEALRILKIGFGQFDGRDTGAIERRTGFQQTNDFSALRTKFDKSGPAVLGMSPDCAA